MQCDALMIIFVFTTFEDEIIDTCAPMAETLQVEM